MEPLEEDVDLGLGIELKIEDISIKICKPGKPDLEINNKHIVKNNLNWLIDQEVEQHSASSSLLLKELASLASIDDHKTVEGYINSLLAYHSYTTKDVLNEAIARTGLVLLEYLNSQTTLWNNGKSHILINEAAVKTVSMSEDQARFLYDYISFFTLYEPSARHYKNDKFEESYTPAPPNRQIRSTINNYLKSLS